MDFIEIKIRNWEKYNKRKDYKRPWWFALSNSLLEDPDFYSFTDGEIKAWIYILSQASKQCSPSVKINTVHSNRVCNIKESTMISCIKKLLTHKVCTESVRNPNATLHNITVQNRTIQNTIAQPDGRASVIDFNILYQEYPRKVGKKAGLRLCKNAIKTPEALLAARKAVKRYSDYCRSNKVEPRFIKHFSTFMNSWEDWCDESVGSVTGVLKQRTTKEIIEDYERRQNEHR